MKVCITGICGFTGSVLAETLFSAIPNLEITGIDNFIRRGSEMNYPRLQKLGIKVFHGDIRSMNDLEVLPRADWIIDAAANPSVMAGVDGLTGSRELMDHNLVGTLNLLEVCKSWKAGLVMLSTSRVYSIEALSSLPVEVRDKRFVLRDEAKNTSGMTEHGIAESFFTTPPISLYGSSKLASEIVALEYGQAFDFPVYVNRCGVLAGAGQFGKIDQGIFSYWIHSYAQKRPLKYIGFAGHQMRDALHPKDIASLIQKQMQHSSQKTPQIINVSGGMGNSASLLELSDWCAGKFGKHDIGFDTQKRPFDIPWLVLDSELARQTWDWTPQTKLENIFEEIAQHAQNHPDWLSKVADS